MFNRGLIKARSRILESIARRVSRSISSISAESSYQNWQPLSTPKPVISPSFDYNAAEIAMRKKQKIQHDIATKKRKFIVPAQESREGSNEEIIQLEVNDLLQACSPKVTEDGVSSNPDTQFESELPLRCFPDKPPIEIYTEIELDIIHLSSTGDGLAYTPSKAHMVVVPFSIPGDKVLAKVYKWAVTHSYADFVKVINPSKDRESVVPRCKYFGDCGGCQLQMMPYEKQLTHKKTVLENAFNRFSGLAPGKIPAVRDTMGSPLQYGYRTKLTPHFNGPRGPKSVRGKLTSVPKFGYNRKNRPEVLDIESCPIGTDILQEGLMLERAKVAVNHTSYVRGKTVLLRESTIREFDDADLQPGASSPVAEFDTTSEPISTEHSILPGGQPELILNFEHHKDHKTYISTETSLTTEYIGPHKFVNRAGSFFQNNNSILGPFTKYIYDNCQPSASSSTDASSSTTTKPIKYLLDAYCGSGLFTITLSKLFTSALGIDIDGRGIEAARENARQNNIPNAGFIEADASDLFADVPFPPDQSLVVIDPPRKGASQDFLRQLCQFRARRVVYVSCNVHTQARDVGMIVKGFGEDGGCRYEIESLRGFDFFPQTGHVEGVCVLNRVEEEEEERGGEVKVEQTKPAEKV